MKKFRNVIFVVLALNSVWFLPQTPVRAETSSNACGLYTRVDAEGLFKETVSDGIFRETAFPAGESCRYSFAREGGTYSVTVKVSTTSAIKEEGIQDSAEDVMTRQKNARKAGAYAAKKFRPIPGLGDDAFWSGSDLWLLKGDTLIVIKVNSFLEGSFKDRPSAEKAREEQDLALSKQVAGTILTRLK